VFETRPIPANGTAHVWNTAYTQVTAATCIAPGEEKLACSLCPAVFDTRPIGVDAANHAGPFGWVTTVTPTETTTGWEVWTCLGCNTAAGEGREVPVLDPLHPPGDWVTVLQATCVTQGWQVKYCQACAEAEVVDAQPIPIDSTAHGPSVWRTEGAGATCTADGLKKECCTLCDEFRGGTETIPMLGHSFGAWARTKEPTMLETGEDTRTCGRCGFQEKRSVEKLPGADKSALNAKLTQARAIAKGNYTDASWNALQAAITAAQAIANQADATQAQVNAQITVLNNAIAGLANNQSPPTPKKYIFTTRYESNFLNWILFILLFGWIWMWF